MRKTLNTVLGIVLLGTVVGLVLLSTIPTLPLTTDAVRYDSTAVHLVDTGDMQVIDGQTLPPGYPYFLAAIYSLFGHDRVVAYFFQFILVGLCGALTFLLAHRYVGIPYWLSLLIGAVVTAWPYMVLHAMLVLSEVLAITLLLLSLVVLIHFLNTPKKSTLLLGGFLLGLVVLTRPVALLLPFWLVLLLPIYWWMTKRPVLSWRLGVMFLLSFLVPLFAWQAYLYATQGNLSGYFSFIPSVIAKSLNLTYELAPPEKIDTLLEPKEATTAPSAAELANPSLGDIAYSKFKNIFLFWNPGAGGYQAQAYIDRYPAVLVLIWIYRIGFFVLLTMAFLTLTRWKEMEFAFLWMIIFYFWGVHTMLFPYPRYMLPVVPLVLVLAGTTVVRFMPSIQGCCMRYLGTVQRRLRDIQYGEYTR